MHEWHIAVHQDQVVVTLSKIVCLHILHHHLQGLLPIVSSVTYISVYLRDMLKND